MLLGLRHVGQIGRVVAGLVGAVVPQSTLFVVELNQRPMTTPCCLVQGRMTLLLFLPRIDAMLDQIASQRQNVFVVGRQAQPVQGPTLKVIDLLVQVQTTVLNQILDNFQMILPDSQLEGCDTVFRLWIGMRATLLDQVLDHVPAAVPTGVVQGRATLGLAAVCHGTIHVPMEVMEQIVDDGALVSARRPVQEGAARRADDVVQGSIRLSEGLQVSSVCSLQQGLPVGSVRADDHDGLLLFMVET